MIDFDCGERPEGFAGHPVVSAAIESWMMIWTSWRDHQGVGDFSEVSIRITSADPDVAMLEVEIRIGPYHHSALIPLVSMGDRSQQVSEVITACEDCRREVVRQAAEDYTTAVIQADRGRSRKGGETS